MLSDKLLQQVMSLDVEERRQVFFALLHDPELKINPFDAINVRQNAELELALQELISNSEAAAGSAESP